MKRPILLILALLLVVTGCTKSEPDTKPPMEPEKELTLFIESIGTGTAVENAAREFERQHPQIRINVTRKDPTKSTEDEELLRHDMIHGPGGKAVRLHRSGQLLDLSAVPTPAWDPLADRVIEENAREGGRRYWVPLALDPVAISLRDTGLAMAGLPLPTPDWTYADLEQIMQGLADAGEAGPFLPLWSFRQPVINAFGGGDYDHAAGQWALDTPENRAAYEYLRRLVEQGLIDPEFKALRGRQSVPTLQISSLLRGRNYQGRSVPLPVGPAGRKVPIHAEGLMLNANLQHREEAIAFARFLLTPEAQRIFAGAGIRPLIADEAAMARWRQAVGAAFVDLMEISLEAGFATYAPESGSDDLILQIQAMVKGQAPIPETLAALDVLLNKQEE